MRRYSVWILTVLALQLAACGEGPGSTTERALKELQAKYDELARDKVEKPVEWASDDLENIGDWEYKVVELSSLAGDGLETALNRLGNDRWELVWIDAVADERVAVFKRPAVSWLSKIPLSQLGRMMWGGAGDAQ